MLQPDGDVSLELDFKLTKFWIFFTALCHFSPFLFQAKNWFGNKIINKHCK